MLATRQRRKQRFQRVIIFNTLCVVATVSNNGGGSYTDPTGLKGAPTLQYQVCSPESPPNVCSNTIVIAF